MSKNESGSEFAVVAAAMTNMKHSGTKEAVVYAQSIGSVGDLTAADEQLRVLAEEIGGNEEGTLSNFRNATDF